MSHPEENKVIIDGIPYYGGLNQPNLKFIKVNVDCWEKIFDLLSLRDILAMSQTCQRMRQIGGHYFRENFHGTVCRFSRSSDLSFLIDCHPIERTDFARFIDTVRILDHNDLKHLRSASTMNLLCSLTTLYLWHINLNEHHLHDCENIQKTIESINLEHCQIDDNSVGEFLASCPKLKCLRFFKVNFRSTAIEVNFFQRTFPILEKFDCYDSIYTVSELCAFLERNPSIKALRTNDVDILRTALNTSTKMQLNYLTSLKKDSDKTKFSTFYSYLKALHTAGSFKQVCLTMGIRISGFSIRIIGAYDFNNIRGKKHFRNFKDLHGKSYMEMTINKLDNDEQDLTIIESLLENERLHFTGTVDQLLWLLRHSKKLRFVMFSDVNADSDALDPYDLNRARRMTGMRQKVHIGFTFEKQYLAAKWKQKNVCYDFIEITRKETIQKNFFAKIEFKQ